MTKDHSSAPPLIEAKFEDLDAGLPLAFPQLVSAASDAVPAEPTWMMVDAAREMPELAATAWLAGAFVLLMVVGAAGAALLFHQRVADILTLLR